MAKDFIPEILSEILSRLLSSSLLDLRLVSKDWEALISSADFIKLHAKRRLGYVDKEEILIQTKAGFHWYNTDIKKELKAFSPCEYKVSLRIIGSCNGLVAILNLEGNVILWNPFLKRSLLVESFCGDSFDVAIGFGYLQDKNNYELVKINSSQGICELHSYSLDGRHEARTFYGFSFLDSEFGVSVADSLFWIARSFPGRKKRLVRLLLCNKECQELPLPSVIDLESAILTNLSELQGRLYVVLSQRVGTNSMSFNVWRVTDTWSLLYRVVKSISYNCLTLIAPLEAGKVLSLFHGSQFLVLNSEGEIVKELNVRAKDATRCVKTLVGLRWNRDMK